MISEPNPYEATSSSQDVQDSEPNANDSLGRLLASLVGFFVCSCGAVVVGEVLSFIALIPPINKLTHLDGEFDGLILIGMPMLAGGCGALAGITLGVFHRNRFARLFASIVGSLPAMFFYSQTYNSHLTDPWQNSPIPMIVVNLIMILATVSAVQFSHFVINLIKLRRANAVTSAPVKKSTSQGLVAASIALFMSFASLFCDYAFWKTLEESEYVNEFFLVGTFLLALLAIAPSVYLLAAYRRRRLIGISCALAAVVGFLLVLGRWYLRLIA
jgi:NAD/NADP transhydrogenase beta subunit